MNSSPFEAVEAGLRRRRWAIYSKLTDDNWVDIFSFVDANALYRLGSVSQRFRAISSLHVLWERFIEDQDATETTPFLIEDDGLRKKWAEEFGGMENEAREVFAEALSVQRSWNRFANWIRVPSHFLCPIAGLAATLCAAVLLLVSSVDLASSRILSILGLAFAAIGVGACGFPVLLMFVNDAFHLCKVKAPRRRAKRKRASLDHYPEIQERISDDYYQCRSDWQESTGEFLFGVVPMTFFVTKLCCFLPIVLLGCFLYGLYGFIPAVATVGGLGGGLFCLYCLFAWETFFVAPRKQIVMVKASRECVFTSMMYAGFLILFPWGAAVITEFVLIVVGLENDWRRYLVGLPFWIMCGVCLAICFLQSCFICCAQFLGTVLDVDDCCATCTICWCCGPACDGGMDCTSFFQEWMYCPCWEGNNMAGVLVLSSGLVTCLMVPFLVAVTLYLCSIQPWIGLILVILAISVALVALCILSWVVFLYYKLYNYKWG